MGVSSLSCLDRSWTAPKLDFTREGSGRDVKINALTIQVYGRGGELYLHPNGAVPSPEILAAKSDSGRGAKVIGEFTALLSIMAYAIVPSIRYAEHGLRNVSSQVTEPAECMGCTRWQMLWQVKVPLAMPVIMLGLNQTIMYGISMLVIAALVGTNGLGQQIYIGLGDGDFGVGMVAGIGMAIIGIVADRMTQAWSRRRQSRYGQ